MDTLSTFFFFCEKPIGLKKLLLRLFMACFYSSYQVFKKVLDMVQYILKHNKLII